MRRATHCMWALYAALAVGLLGCALLAQRAHSWPGVAFFTAAAVGAALAICHTAWLLDEYRHLLARYDADNRAQARRNAEEDDVRIALAAASCCEVAWTSLGEQHDPATCTQKDQTT